MNKQLRIKTKESLISVLPITPIVFVLSVTFVPVSNGTLMLFLVGAAFLIFGMGLFSLGVDLSLMTMGDGIGTQLAKAKKLWLVVLTSLIIGFVITIAEPDFAGIGRTSPINPKGYTDLYGSRWHGYISCSCYPSYFV